MNNTLQRKMDEERKRDLEFIPNLLRWPRWPFLTMKRGPQNEDLGFLYPTVAALLDDGWRVD